jgi:hypothetical protein
VEEEQQTLQDRIQYFQQLQVMVVVKEDIRHLVHQFILEQQEDLEEEVQLKLQDHQLVQLQVEQVIHPQQVHHKEIQEEQVNTYLEVGLQVEEEVELL